MRLFALLSVLSILMIVTFQDSFLQVGVFVQGLPDVTKEESEGSEKDDCRDVQECPLTRSAASDKAERVVLGGHDIIFYKRTSYMRFRRAIRR